MTSKKLCIFLFLHDVFAICGFSNAHLKTDSVLALYCVWVNHNVADDLVDGSYHFGIQNSNGPTLM
jgi:hypothetical protein